ncbi:MAG: ABC transporter ATP-binding protein [Methylovulum sp.]|nr:ABC transporter ATP-binding protein [Methylovulum sp.]
MSQPIIKIENLSKLYRLGEVGTGTLSHDLNRWWKTKILRKEDPYSKIGTVNDRTQIAQKGEHVWALRDINLELQAGDVLGIIGKNGAGKSTLLKLLSQVTSPSTGRIRARGRMASLLEVGTGFHPEMTGRENIYMNGTIMGMRKAEITSKLDEIVDFSGVAKYLDTPVKRYSSGMTVRLGFAIAAHLEPEILVVDEVLAVGDAEFQKKAIGKMQDVSKSYGRTVLFVSHNMAAVKSLCKSGMVLINGSKGFEGNITEAIDFYQNNNALATNENNHWEFGNAAENDNIRVDSIKINPLNGTTLDISSGVQITIDFFNKIKDITEDLTFEIVSKDDVLVFHHGFVFAKDQNSKLGKHKITAIIPAHLLNANMYSMNLLFGQSQRYVLFKQDHICAFEIENIPMENNMSILPGVVRPAITYALECHG